MTDDQSVITTFEVNPGTCHDLVDALVEAYETVISRQAGFSAARLHVNDAQTRVAVVSHWRSRADFLAMLRLTEVRERNRRLTALCRSFEPVLYDVVATYGRDELAGSGPGAKLGAEQSRGGRMAETAMEKVAAAKARVPQVSPEELAELRKRGALIVDVRDADEVSASGKVPGAVNVSRGMLEFRADETTPSHNPEFRKDRTIVLYCGSGGRSALAGQALLDMGYSDVRNLGGFKDWAEKGHPTEPA